jgi:hypothetical protein
MFSFDVFLLGVPVTFSLLLVVVMRTSGPTNPLPHSCFQITCRNINDWIIPWITTLPTKAATPQPGIAVINPGRFCTGLVLYMMGAITIKPAIPPTEADTAAYFFDFLGNSLTWWTLRTSSSSVFASTTTFCVAMSGGIGFANLTGWEKLGNSSSSTTTNSWQTDRLLSWPQLSEDQ